MVIGPRVIDDPMVVPGAAQQLVGMDNFEVPHPELWRLAVGDPGHTLPKS